VAPGKSIKRRQAKGFRTANAEGIAACALIKRRCLERRTAQRTNYLA
jgi:hypothetical protein